MGHEIREHDTVLSVREPTWHNLDIRLDDYPTREEAEKLVHDYTVEREPVYRRDPRTGEFYMVEDLEFNIHSKSNEALSVVPRERPEVQPYEAWDLVELVQKNGKNIKVETAGTLRNGRDIWILIRLDEPVVINGDPNGTTLPFFCLQNSYVPGAAFRGQATNVRVVCWNTSRASDMIADALGVNFSFRHSGTLLERVEEIRAALEGWRNSIDEWKLAKEFMATQKVTVDQTNWFIEHFIPEPHGSLTTERVKRNIEDDRTDLLIEYLSDMNRGIQGTALGLFEAASSWNEHVRRAQSPLTRFKRSILEPSDILLQAHDLALEATRV